MNDGIRLEVGLDKTISTSHPELISQAVITNDVLITASDAFQRTRIKRTSEKRIRKEFIFFLVCYTKLHMVLIKVLG